MSMKAHLTIAIALIGSGLLSGCQGLGRAIDMAQYQRTLDTYAQTDTTVTEVTRRTHADGRDATLISAFYGLDSALPKGPTNRVACQGGGGGDGMPVIFSHEVDIKTLEPGDFKITTASGAVKTVTCLTLAPADDPGELRTALLTGEYGSATDQPVTVDVKGNVLSLDGVVNFKGARVAVTPLEAGPTMVFAEIMPQAQWELGRPATRLPWGGGERCPVGTKQVVRVTWGGGITKPDGPDPADDKERKLYRVTIEGAGGLSAEITPFALADLNDGDNNHLLCLDTTDKVKSVFFPAGFLTDPREDLNPDTTINLPK